MKACNRYELDGEILEIPLRWDQRTQAYVEDYGDYIDQPAYTPAGRPILLTIEDACPHADLQPDGMEDCGSCNYYRQTPGTLLGVCGHPALRRVLPEKEEKKE